MMEPADVQLPFPSWSPGQWDAISEIGLSDTKYTIVEAPTGSGKSAIALALARMGGDRVHLVTGTKQLQDQYATLGPYKVMGRNNFPCIIEPGTGADAAPCTVGMDCEEKKPEYGPPVPETGLSKRLGRTRRQEIGPPRCPYYAQKWTAQRQQETVFNYAYWLAMNNYGHWPKADLLVLDEAHLLEDEVRRFASVPLRRSWIRQLGVTTSISWPFLDEMENWREWATNILPDIGQEHDEVTANKRYMSSIERRYYNAVMGVWKVAVLLSRSDVDEDSWVISPQPWGVEFRPVWVTDIAPRIVFRHAERIMLMSATILSRELFCTQLGIPAEEATFIRVASTFPAERRPLIYRPAGRVKASDPDSLRALTREIDEVLDKYPTERGIIHTGSYKIAQHIAATSRHKARFISHDTRTRASAISHYRVTPGAILVSPSVGTGVDLPYDLCRVQIIAKIPFPDRGDPQVAKRMREIAPGIPNPRGQSWYSWIAACNLVQAYGRGMRAADDACDTYLLDSNWRWFKHSVQSMLPAWFLGALKHEHVDVPDLLSQLRA